VGAGPAGIATAIQLCRQGIEPVIVERDEIGGLLRNAALVENYPGFPGGIRGRELVDLFTEQLKRTAADVIADEVLELELKNGGFQTKCRDRLIESDVVVIASGTRPRSMPDAAISEKARPRVLYEVYTLLEAEGKRIVVAGAGDAAFDYASGLLEKNEVVIMNRGWGRKCLPALWQKVRASRSVAYMEHARVQRVMDLKDGLLVEYVSGESRDSGVLEADYLLIAVGRDPCLDFVGGNLKGDLRVLAKTGRIHMVGDVKNGPYRQVGISVGDGLRAAMRISQGDVGDEG